MLFYQKIDARFIIEIDAGKNMVFFYINHTLFQVKTWTENNYLLTFCKIPVIESSSFSVKKTSLYCVSKIQKDNIICLLADFCFIFKTISFQKRKKSQYMTIFA